MKRLVLFLALCCLPAVAQAQGCGDEIFAVDCPFQVTLNRGYEWSGEALSAVVFAYVPDENGVAEGSFDLPQGGFTFTFFEPLGQGFRVELEAVDTGDCEWGDTDISAGSFRARPVDLGFMDGPALFLGPSVSVEVVTFCEAELNWRYTVEGQLAKSSFLLIVSSEVE